MREIKFRAIIFELTNPQNCFEVGEKWKFEKIIMNPYGYGDVCNDDYFDLNKWLGHPMSDTHHKYILQQYTGLKDKNCKEIYEGDIVKTKDSGTYPDIYSLYVVRNGKERVEDNEGYQDNLISGFYVELCFYNDYLGIKHKVSKQYSHIDFLEDCEIIGNIYENPELLNRGER